MTMMEKNWIEIGALEDIPKQGARVLKTKIGCVAVFRTTDDKVFALEDKCPHKAGPLSQGIVHGTSVTCPLHNWVISLESGTALGADEGSVRTYRVTVSQGRIFIDSTALRVSEVM